MIKVKVYTRFHKPFRVILLSDAQALLGLPVFLLSWLYHSAFKPIFRNCVHLAIIPIYLIPSSTRSLNRNSFLFYAKVNMGITTFLLYIDWQHVYINLMLEFLCYAILMFSHAVIINVLIEIQSAYDGLVVPSKPDPNGNSLNDFFGTLGQKIPLYLVDDEWSRAPMVVSWMIALYFIFLIISFYLFSADALGQGIIVFFALAVFTFLINYRIEHIAAHAPRGKLIEYRNTKHISDKLMWLMEKGRVWLVWPVNFFMPRIYHYSHAVIHHRENNGPADPVSTLRFNQSRLLSFQKGVLWHGVFVRLVPLETLRYLYFCAEKALFKNCIRNYFLGLLVLGVYLVFLPKWFMFGLVTTVLSGFDAYLRSLKFHGFHDSRRSNEIDACSPSPIHQGHHMRPRKLHCLLGAEHSRHFWYVKDQKSENFNIFKMQEYRDLYLNNMLMVQALFWQKQFSIIDKFIDSSELQSNRYKRLVTGNLDKISDGWLADLDNRLSPLLGRAIFWLSSQQSSGKPLLELVNTQSNSVAREERVSNFYRFVTKDNRLSRGMY
jgi:hypothetical protein